MAKQVLSSLSYIGVFAFAAIFATCEAQKRGGGNGTTGVSPVATVANGLAVSTGGTPVVPVGVGDVDMCGEGICGDCAGGGWWAAAGTRDVCPYRARLLTWENVYAGRGRTGQYNAQIEFHDDGNFITRSNNVERVYRRVNPDDWDGDGLANEIDPNTCPASRGGDLRRPKHVADFAFRRV